MSNETAKLALGRQVHALRHRLAADDRPAITYREQLLSMLASVESVLADEETDGQTLKRSGYRILRMVLADWSLGRSAVGQELLVLSGRVQKLGQSVP